MLTTNNNMCLIEDMIDYTNDRLISWYNEAKDSYGVVGKGYTKYNEATNEVEIHYTENGVDCVYKIDWFNDYNIDTVCNMWQREADPEIDKI